MGFAVQVADAFLCKTAFDGGLFISSELLDSELFACEHQHGDCEPNMVEGVGFEPTTFTFQGDCVNLACEHIRGRAMRGS